MLRKQRKLQPWRRFGYVILIIIKSGELLLWFSPRIINGLRSYIKHSKGCFIRYPNTLKLVQKKLGCASFSQPLLGVWISDETLFLVFDMLLLKFVLCCRPIALCVLCVDTGDWVYKVNRVINRLMIETQDPLHLPVCRPFISINQRAWLYVSLDNGQKSTRISPSHKL